jgi:hypothetical protein
VVDVTAPVLSGGVGRRGRVRTITLEYDEGLDETSVPDPADFAVTADGDPFTINGVASNT